MVALVFMLFSSYDGRMTSKAGVLVGRPYLSKDVGVSSFPCSFRVSNGGVIVSVRSSSLYCGRPVAQKVRVFNPFSIGYSCGGLFAGCGIPVIGRPAMTSKMCFYSICCFSGSMPVPASTKNLEILSPGPDKCVSCSARRLKVG